MKSAGRIIIYNMDPDPAGERETWRSKAVRFMYVNCEACVELEVQEGVTQTGYIIAIHDHAFNIGQQMWASIVDEYIHPTSLE